MPISPFIGGYKIFFFSYVLERVASIRLQK